MGIRGSFGLSLSTEAAIAQGGMGTDCTTDFISIPGGQAAAATIPPLAVGVDRYCGRVLSTADDSTTNASVCSAVVPFKLGVTFDGTEALAGTPMLGELNVNEASGVAADQSPLGT